MLTYFYPWISPIFVSRGPALIEQLIFFGYFLILEITNVIKIETAYYIIIIIVRITNSVVLVDSAVTLFFDGFELQILEQIVLDGVEIFSFQLMHSQDCSQVWNFSFKYSAGLD